MSTLGKTSIKWRSRSSGRVSNQDSNSGPLDWLLSITQLAPSFNKSSGFFSRSHRFFLFLIESYRGCLLFLARTKFIVSTFSRLPRLSRNWTMLRVAKDLRRWRNDLISILNGFLTNQKTLFVRGNAENFRLSLNMTEFYAKA